MDKLNEVCHALKGREQNQDDAELPVMSQWWSGLPQHVTSSWKWLEFRKRELESKRNSDTLKGYHKLCDVTYERNIVSCFLHLWLFCHGNNSWNVLCLEWHKLYWTMKYSSIHFFPPEISPLLSFSTRSTSLSSPQCT